MPKIETIETLAFLGGLGSVTSPILGVYGFGFYLTFPFFYPIALITGILGAIFSIRASTRVSKMPYRACQDLQMAGFLVLLVGFIAGLNWLMIISGTLIIIAYIECNALWKNIRQARQETGWPYVTVATAAESNWARRLSCRYCGAPLVVKTASAKGPWVRVKTLCPLDGTNELLRLPLARLDAWTSVFADRLHRCETCGERTAALIVVHQNGLITRLQPYCPDGHSNRIYRTIWTPLYPHVARTPDVDVGFRSPRRPPSLQPSIQVRFAHPIGPGRADVYTQVTPQRFHPIRTIPISSTEAPTANGSISFCHQCGVRVEPSDRYCFRCGTVIK